MTKNKIITLILFLFLVICSTFALAEIENFKVFTSKNSIAYECSVTADSIVVQNTGDIDSGYFVTFRGEASKFATVEPLSFVLDAGQSQDIDIYYNIPCDFTGSYDLEVIITTVLNLQKIVQKEVTIEKPVNILVQSSINTNQILPCNEANYNFKIINNGSFEEVYSFSFPNPFGKYTTVNANKVVLGAGDSFDLTFNVVPPCNIYGEHTIPLIIKTEKTNLVAKTSAYLSIEQAYDFDFDLGENYPYVKNSELTFVDTESSSIYSLCSNAKQVLPFKIKNNADIPNNYAINLDGPEWVDLLNDKLTLDVGSEGFSGVYVNTNDIYGNYNIIISVLSELGAIQKTENLTLSVDNCYEPNILTLDGKKSIVLDYNPVKVPFVIGNKGSKVATYELSLEGEPWLSIEPSLLVVNSGEFGEMYIVSQPSDLVSRGKYKFNIISQVNSDGVVYRDSLKLSLVNMNFFDRVYYGFILPYLMYIILLIVLLLILLLLLLFLLKKYKKNIQKWKNDKARRRDVLRAKKERDLVKKKELEKKVKAEKLAEMRSKKNADAQKKRTKAQMRAARKAKLKSFFGKIPYKKIFKLLLWLLLLLLLLLGLAWVIYKFIKEGSWRDVVHDYLWQPIKWFFIHFWLYVLMGLGILLLIILLILLIRWLKAKKVLSRLKDKIKSYGEKRKLKREEARLKRQQKKAEKNKRPKRKLNIKINKKYLKWLLILLLLLLIGALFYYFWFDDYLTTRALKNVTENRVTIKDVYNETLSEASTNEPSKFYTFFSSLLFKLWAFLSNYLIYLLYLLGLLILLVLLLILLLWLKKRKTTHKEYDFIDQQMIIRTKNIACGEIIVKLLKPLYHVGVMIRKVKKPTFIHAGGLVYEHLEIKKENFSNEDIDEVLVRFRVKKSWMKRHNVKQKDIQLKRYQNKWLGVNTKFISEDKKYYYYESILNHLSYFAIVGYPSEKIKKEKQIIAIPIVAKKPKKKIAFKINKDKIKKAFGWIFGVLLFIILCILGFFFWVALFAFVVAYMWIILGVITLLIIIALLSLLIMWLRHKLKGINWKKLFNKKFLHKVKEVLWFILLGLIILLLILLCLSLLKPYLVDNSGNESIIFNETNSSEVELIEEVIEVIEEVDAFEETVCEVVEVPEPVSCVDINITTTKFVSKKIKDNILYKDEFIEVQTDDSSFIIPVQPESDGVVYIDLDEIMIEEEKGIPNQKWDEDSVHTMNLSMYFNDPDEDSLYYSNTELQNIEIKYNAGIAVLMPQKNWYGSEFVIFTASDMKGGKVDSNLVQLTVQDVEESSFWEIIKGVFS
jgi:PGF-pre-PGF domain-containing protein